ncbi:hypothetical protein VE03_07521 [Pseudogymnoascus sp. 23342-1-I1]|nr:hypothetical protein VE03_07521 [Pseudogymnoascus sp. 23342-1-I1]
MRHLTAILLLSNAASSIAASEPARPRGVGPDFAKHYKGSKETFTCITAPSVVIPFSSINDDYCDCPDGSDEPGTSACTYLSSLSPIQPIPGTSSGTSNTTLALPGYYCKNKGHQPGYIPSSYVNDGVCDYDLCCDGSDEWAGVGGVACEDRCAAMGKEWRKKEEERVKSARASLLKRGELLKQAEKLRAGIQQRIGELESEVVTLQTKEEEARRRLEDVEWSERSKVVKGASEKASKVTVLAKLAKARVEELRNGLTSVIEKRDAANSRVQKLEAILEAFKVEYNPNFNDEGVKRAVKAWEDYVAEKDPNSDSDASGFEKDLEEIGKPDSEEQGINWAEWEKEEEESDVEALYSFEAYLPPSLRTWVHDKVRSFRRTLVDNGLLADTTGPAGTESRAVTEARDAYNNIKSDRESRRSELEDKKNDLTADYGPQDVFRALKGSCVDIDSGEYTYELCWMDKSTQKSKKNGGSTQLGTFKRFDTVEVDEDVGADGRGLGVGERLTMVFEEGQQCWNGPKRSTIVVMACREKDEVWRVVEAEKCVYRMEVGTPAVCEDSAGEQRKPAKDEL